MANSADCARRRGALAACRALLHALDGFLAAPRLGVAVLMALSLGLLVSGPSPAQAAFSFSPKTDFPVGAGPYGVTRGDFNGDGKLDIATVNYSANTASILLGDGSGGFGAKADFAVATLPFSVASGDFNGDGKLDLAVASVDTNKVSVLLGNGAGSLGAKTDFPTGAYPNMVVSADLNRDGKLDLATANLDANTVSVLLGNGAGSFGAKTDFSTGTRPGAVTSGDFNGDLKPDLATANFNSNGVSILLGNGAGSFGAKTDFTVGAAPYSITSADFNGDGRPDLATANLNSANVSVLLGNGAGGFGAKTDFPVGTRPFGVISGDFNSDGKPDLAAANNISANVSVLLGNGAGNFGAAINFPTGTAPDSVTSGDFNGDLKPDLAIANQGANSVSVLLNTSISAAPVVTLSPGATSYVEGGPAVLLDGAATVSDPDSPNFNGGGLAVDLALITGDDFLAIQNQGGGPGQIGVSGTTVSLGGTPIGTIVGGGATASGSLQVAFNAQATPAAVQALLRAITFSNVSDAPSSAQLVRVLLSDGHGGVTDPSTAPTKDISITPIDDAPVLSGIEATPTLYTEGGAPTPITATLDVSDVDSANLLGATASISGGFAPGEDELLFTNQNGISGSYNASTGVLSLSGLATLAQYRDALRSVSYRSTSENPSAAPHTITFTASSGPLPSNAQSRAVTVAGVNDAPVAASQSVQVLEDTPLGITLGATDFDSAALSFLVASQPHGGTLSGGGASLTYTPAPDFNGADSFTFQASDGTAISNIATVSITVNPANDAPVAVGQSVQVLEDTPSAITLGATDIDSPALNFAIVAGPAHGTLSLGVAGLTYVPALNFNGADAFSFKASDGVSDSNVATIALQVLAANDAPSARGDAFTVSGLAPLTVAAPGVLGNDADADGDALRATIVAGPAHGVLSLNANGSFSYTPAVGFNGADSFTYRAADAASQSQSAMVALSVSGNPSRSLSLSLSSPAVREGASVIGTLTLSRPAATSFAILLSSSSAAAAAVPASVQVLAGQSRAAFRITAPRNTLATGVLLTTISARAGDYGTASARLSVTDLEVPTLTFTVAPTLINDNFGPAAAVGTVTRNTPLDKPLTVRLLSSNVAAVRVPASVVILPGARSASFLVAAIDNRVANAPRRVSLTASALGFKPVVATLSVADNGRVTRDLRLFLENSGRYAERVGGQVAQGSVTLPGAPLTQPLVITLASADSTRILLPRTVVLPAGKSVVSFSFRVLDNTIVEGDFSRVWVTARSLGYGTSALLTLIQDNDGPALSLSLSKASISEAAGSLTATLTRRNTPVNATTAALVVALASSNRNWVTVPATATIAKGKASVTFSVSLVNNRVVDGTRRVTLTASKAGLTPGTATLDVLDDDAPRPTASLAAPDPAAFSSASASAGDGVKLRFWGALDAASAADAPRYQVAVNGEVVKPEGVSYDAAACTVSITLPEGALQAGDRVEVSWRELLDAQGQALSGSTGALTAR